MAVKTNSVGIILLNLSYSFSYFEFSNFVESEEKLWSMRRAKSGKIWTSNCPRGTADQNLGRVIPSQIT